MGDRFAAAMHEEWFTQIPKDQKIFKLKQFFVMSLYISSMSSLNFK